MTPSEFKSWFEVFCEAIDGTPTPKQWGKIRAKVREMSDGPVWLFEVELPSVRSIPINPSEQQGVAQANHIFHQAGS